MFKIKVKYVGSSVQKSFFMITRFFKQHLLSMIVNTNCLFFKDPTCVIIKISLKTEPIIQNHSLTVDYNNIGSVGPM